MTQLKEDGRATPGRPMPSTATRPTREYDAVLTKVRGQALAFDLETRGNDVQWTDAPWTHVQLASFVVNGGPAQLTTGGPALQFGPDHSLLDLLLVAGTLAGHGIMNYDLIVLVHQYPHQLPSIWELANTKRLWDTQLVESLLDPPEARWKEGQAQKHYKLEEIAQRRGFPVGKTLDLAAVAARCKREQLKQDPNYTGSGFELIPWNNDRENVDLLEYARQDSRLVWDLIKDQLKRLGQQTTYKRTEQTARVPIEGRAGHFEYRRLTKLAKVPKLTRDYIAREHKVAALAAQVQLNGFRVDTNLLQSRIAWGEAKKARILADLTDRYGLPTMTKDGKHEAKSPQSTAAGKEAIRNALLDTGLDPYLLPIKVKSKTPDLSKETMQAIIDHGNNPKAAEIAEAVLDLNGVRSIYQQVKDSLVGDRVHPNISFRQASGRWSFTRPGLTVVGKRGGRVVEREVFIAEPGHVMITADLSQVDARAVAAMSQDPAYMELFGEGRDVWTEMANLFGINRDQVKVIGHGSNYGMGVQGTKRHNPGIPMEAIVAFHQGREKQFPKLMEWQEHVRWLAGQGVLLDNGWGRLLRVDPDRAYTQAPALSGQSAARDIMMQGLLNLVTALPDTLTMLRAVVHDEVVLSVPHEDVREVAYELNKAMTFPWAPHWGGDPIQIKGEVSIGTLTWASAYSKE